MISGEVDKHIGAAVRKAVLQELCKGGSFAGALRESEFMAELFDTAHLPGPRGRTAHEDIVLHREQNEDWEATWPTRS